MFTIGAHVSGKFHGHSFSGVIEQSALSARDASVTRVYVAFDKPVCVSGTKTLGVSLAIPANGIIADRMFKTDFIRIEQ